MPSDPLGSSALAFYCAAWILYIVDSACLLFVNEVAFAGHATGGWRVRTPAGLPWLGGRFLYVPNPFVPHCVVLRRSWSAVTCTPDKAQDLRSELLASGRHLRWERWLSIGAHVQLFLVLPLVYYRLGSLAASVAVLFLYVQIAVILVHLARYWRGQALPWRGYAAIVFESLICIPYAANLYRRAFAASADRKGGFRDFWQIVEPPSKERAGHELADLVDRELDGSEGSPERTKFLLGFRSWLLSS